MPQQPSARHGAATSTNPQDLAEPAELSYETITSLLGQARTPQQPPSSAGPDVRYKTSHNARADGSAPAGAGPGSRSGGGSESSGDLDLDLPDVPKGPPVAPKAGLPSEASRAAASGKGTASDRKLDRQLQQLLAEAEGPHAGEFGQAFHMFTLPA